MTGVRGKRRARYWATNRPAGEPNDTTRSGFHVESRLRSGSATESSMGGCPERATSSDTSSRSTCVPISRVSVVSKAVEWVVNGGARLPNELTISTGGGWGASAARARLAPASNNGTQSRLWHRRTKGHVAHLPGQKLH